MITFLLLFLLFVEPALFLQDKESRKGMIKNILYCISLVVDYEGWDADLLSIHIKDLLKHIPVNE